MVDALAQIDLKGKRIIERRTISPDEIIADSTPINKVVELLTLKPFYFIHEQNKITKILTGADLNHLAVRTYLHVYFDHLEMLLSNIIEQYLPENAWLDMLSTDAENKIREIQAKKMHANYDTAFIDCTTLPQKITIFDKCDELRHLIVETKYRDLCYLRNQLDHYGPIIQTIKNKVPIIGDKDEAIEFNQTLLYIRQWIEKLSPILASPELLPNS